MRKERRITWTDRNSLVATEFHTGFHSSGGVGVGSLRSSDATGCMYMYLVFTGLL